MIGGLYLGEYFTSGPSSYDASVSNTRLYVDIGGAETILEGSLAISESTSRGSAAFQIPSSGARPVPYAPVRFGLGSLRAEDLIFRGKQQVTTQYRKETVANQWWEGSAVDSSMEFNRYLAWGSYTSIPGDVIALDLLSKFAPDFTGTYVQLGLPNVTLILEGVTMDSAFKSLAKAIAGYYYRDKAYAVHLFTSETPAFTPDTIDTTILSLLMDPPLQWKADVSMTRNRVVGVGGNTALLATVDPGETILPIRDATMFDASANTVMLGAQRVNYTGKQMNLGGSLVGPGIAPTVAPGATVVVGTGVETGVHNYAYTDVTATGETLPSPSVAVTVGHIANPLVAPGAVILAGAGIEDGVHLYAYTDVTTAGETLPTPMAAVTHAPTQIAPTAIGTATVTPTGSGPLTPNTSYTYVFTFRRISDNAETTRSPTATFTSSATGQTATIPQSGMTSMPSGWVRAWYRSKVTSAGAAPYFEIPAVHWGYGSGVSGTDFGEDAADNQLLGNSPPTTNGSAVNRTTLTLVAVGPSGTNTRNIYRTVAGGSQLKLAGVVLDNVTTTYTDSASDASLGANAPTTNTATANQVNLSLIAVGISPTTSRKVYRTAAGQSQLKLLTTIGNNTATTFTDNTPDASLGANAPTGDTSGLPQTPGQVNAGASTMPVASASPYVSTGGWVVIGNGQQVVRYTGISGNTLTGIPTSGAGSIGATVAYSSTATATNALTGIPASGPGSITYAPPLNALVRLYAVQNDTSSQAFIAGIEGSTSTGVYEFKIDDASVLTQIALNARCTADLLQYASSGGVLTISYTSYDRKNVVGRPITINRPADGIVGTFVIQSVSISQIGVANQYPLFACTASSVRFSFEDYLRRAMVANP